MRAKHFMIVLVLLVLALPASPAQAGGVVSVCDETAPQGCTGGWRHGDVQLQRHDHPDVHHRDRG